MHINTALKKFSDSRRVFLETMENLSQSQLIHPVVAGEWTIKDILGHLTSWENVCLIPLRDYANEDKFEAEILDDYLEWNDIQAAAKQSKDIETIMQEFHQTREDLLSILKNLPPDKWTQNLTFPWGESAHLENMLTGLSWHEREHLEDIKLWLASK